MKNQHVETWMTRVISVLLAVLICYASFTSVATIVRLQGNARVLNYTGIVRGATQRLVKQEINGIPNDELIVRLDEILSELSDGSGKGKHGIYAIRDPSYQDLLAALTRTWGQVKREIGVVRSGGGSERLYSLSEAHFELADQTVSAAEEYSEMRVANAKVNLTIFGVSLIVLMFLFWVSTQREKMIQAELVRAESASRAKSEFLSRMSHEIRTPMNGVIGMTAIARMSIDDRAKVEECLRKIDLSSGHLLALINDVLDMSRIESGRLEISLSPFSLRVLIENLTGLYHAQASEKGIHFETVLVGEVPSEAVGDSLRLNQILANLLSNALKFTPAGGTINLRVIRMQDTAAAARFRFEVCDTGCGVAKENCDRIFEAFEQENGLVAHDYGGTGLGLSIVKRLAELMGGRVCVQSTVGVGSVFSVELPLQVSEQARGPEHFDAKAGLLVGQEPEINDAVTLRLERMGLTVCSAPDGRQGLRLLEESMARGNAVDFCIVNFVMPDMDGVEMVRRIRELPGSGSLKVWVSAFDTSNLESEARAAGADGVLAKPLFRSSLTAALSDFHREEAVQAPPDGGHDFSGYRILLAEDNALNREIACELLAATGAELDTVENGKEAVERFAASEADHFDLILMDVQMPVMDGYEATRRIRVLQRPDAGRVPIFAMTADAFVEDIEKSRAAGMDAHISKPIDVNAVYKQLGELFRQRKGSAGRAPESVPGAERK